MIPLIKRTNPKSETAHPVCCISCRVPGFHTVVINLLLMCVMLPLMFVHSDSD